MTLPADNKKNNVRLKMKQKILADEINLFKHQDMILIKSDF